MTASKRKEENILMSYNEWEILHRYRVKAHILRKLHSFFYLAVLFMIICVPPMLMILHYIMRGY